MKVYEFQMRIMQAPDLNWVEIGMKQIPIHTWKRDDMPIIFDSIGLTAFSVDPDWMSYTIRFHDAQTGRLYDTLWEVKPAFIGDLRVRSFGVPEIIVDWIEECLVDALCSHII